MKALKNKEVEQSDINYIISIIENNHDIIYPDPRNDNTIATTDSNLIDNIGEENKQNIQRPNITIEEWRSKLLEKYESIRQTCNKNFPGLWNSLEFELSILRILNIKGCSLPFAGIILGPPSSSKTLGIELFRNYNNVYYSDNFSAKAFVTHSTGAPKEALAEIDLLPKIKNKCLLASELSPIFSKKDDDLMDVLGILTRVLDGHGYQSDSGAHVRKGYTGQHMFTMIGAAVDIPYRVHKQLSNLGPKLFFHRIRRSHKKEEEYIQMLMEDNFGIRKQELQDKINEYNQWFDQGYPFEEHIDKEHNNLLKIPFGEKNADGFDNNEYRSICHMITNFGILLSYLRGTVTTFHIGGTQGSNYGYSTPSIEEPDRAMTHLLNLAKAHALSQGRTFLSLEDIPILIRAVLSTASIERTLVFDLLLANQGSVTSSILRKSLKISKLTALKTMAELEALGLVSGNLLETEIDDQDEGDNRMSSLLRNSNSNERKTITLKTDFEWFLSKEFQRLREGFFPEGNCRYDIKEEPEAEKSVKKNSPHIQQKLFELECSSTFATPFILKNNTRTLPSLSYKQTPILPPPPSPLLYLPLLTKPLMLPILISGQKVPKTIPKSDGIVEICYKNENWSNENIDCLDSIFNDKSILMEENQKVIKKMRYQ